MVYNVFWGKRTFHYCYLNLSSISIHHKTFFLRKKGETEMMLCLLVFIQKTINYKYHNIARSTSIFVPICFFLEYYN